MPLSLCSFKFFIFFQPEVEIISSSLIVSSGVSAIPSDMLLQSITSLVFPLLQVCASFQQIVLSLLCAKWVLRLGDKILGVPSRTVPVYDPHGFPEPTSNFFHLPKSQLPHLPQPDMLFPPPSQLYFQSCLWKTWRNSGSSGYPGLQNMISKNMWACSMS
jgi:hypothetical protein